MSNKELIKELETELQLLEQIRQKYFIADYRFTTSFVDHAKPKSKERN